MSELNNWHVIAAMSFVTIGIRWVGFFIMEHVPLTGNSCFNRCAHLH
jgi:hypothetical protein